MLKELHETNIKLLSNPCSISLPITHSFFYLSQWQQSSFSVYSVTVLKGCIQTCWETRAAAHCGCMAGYLSSEIHFYTDHKLNAKEDANSTATGCYTTEGKIYVCLEFNMYVWTYFHAISFVLYQFYFKIFKLVTKQMITHRF